MQSLSKDEEKAVMSEVLVDKLTAIEDYVKDLPGISKRLSRVEKKVDKLDNRFVVLDAVVRAHEKDLRKIKKLVVLV